MAACPDADYVDYLSGFGLGKYSRVAAAWVLLAMTVTAGGSHPSTALAENENL